MFGDRLSPYNPSYYCKYDIIYMTNDDVWMMYDDDDVDSLSLRLLSMYSLQVIDVINGIVIAHS